MKKKKGNSKTPQERLRIAIEELKKGSVLDILGKNDVDVNEVGNNGETFLHSVFKHARTRRLNSKTIIEIFTIFFDLGISLEAKNKREETVLHLAVIHRFEEVVDFLIERSANVNVINAQGDYIGHYLMRDELYRCQKIPLKSTSMENRLFREKRTAKFIDFLWSRGFDFDCKNNEGLSPLFLAIKYNLQHILSTLLKYTNDINYVDEKGRTLLQTYLRINAWLEDYTERPMLTYDFYKGRYVLSIMSTFLDKDVPIDVTDNEGMTALEYSYLKKNWEIVQLIVERVVENDTKYLTKFLHFVIKNPVFSVHGDPSSGFLATLVSKTSNFHNELISGYTTLQLAVLERRLDVIRLLNDKEMQFNVLTPDGKNLLHLLSQDIDNEVMKTHIEKDEELVDYLVSRGCDVNATNKMRQSPLHEAAANGKIAIVKKLMEHGADVNMRKAVLMWTPLHFAADNDQSIEIVESLIANGADVNLKDTCGRTPLHLALENSGRLTKLLLSSGARADVQDKRKFTPLMLAMSRKYFKEVEELLKYGANFDDSDSNLCHFSHYMDNDTIERRPILDYILQSHWIKLKAADLPCPVGFKKRAQESANFKTFYSQCREEIEKLKKAFIDERTSLLDFLQMDRNRRCSYLGNEKLRNFVNFPRTDLFPNYANLILGSYHEASARKPLLSPAKLGWFTLTNIILPDICVDRILAYLSNATLLNLVDEESIEK